MFSNQPRWIEPFLGQSYFKELASFCKNGANQERYEQAKQERLKRPLMLALVVGGLVGLAIALLIAILVFGDAPKPGTQPNYLALFAISGGTIGLAAIITYVVSAAGNSRIQKRLDSISAVCDAHDELIFSCRVDVQGEVVGSLPWFVTEEFENLRGLAVGNYSGHEICFVECDQTIDPVLKVTKSHVLQTASQLVAPRHKRLRKRDMEAVVFEEPLEFLPDMLIVPIWDPNRAYFGRALKGNCIDLPLPSVLAGKYWATAAQNITADEFLSHELVTALVEHKWAIVQIIGGQCCVFTQQWDGASPSEAALTEQQISFNLQFATRIFDALKSKSPARTFNEEQGEPSQPTEALGVAGSVGAATATENNVATWNDIKSGYLEPQTENLQPVVTSNASTDIEKYDVKIKMKRVRHSVLSSVLLLGFGIPLFLVCGLASIVSGLGLACGMTSESWPAAEATITKSEIVTTENSIDSTLPKLHRASVEYEFVVENETYRSEKIQFGGSSVSSNKVEADSVVGEFPVGSKATTHYLSFSPGCSVLKTGVANINQTVAALAASFVFFILGLVLCIWFLSGKQVPANSL